MMAKRWKRSAELLSDLLVQSESDARAILGDAARATDHSLANLIFIWIGFARERVEAGDAAGAARCGILLGGIIEKLGLGELMKDAQKQKLRLVPARSVRIKRMHDRHEKWRRRYKELYPGADMRDATIAQARKIAEWWGSMKDVTMNGKRNRNKKPSERHVLRVLKQNPKK
jgi:hypothetical protein